MKDHEYQAKELLAKYGVPVPRGRVAETADEAAAIAKELGVPVAVKAHIHAGGRGKGGGIKLAGSPEQAREVASQIIGMNLVTHQTGPEGRLVKRVLVEEQLLWPGPKLAGNATMSALWGDGGCVTVITVRAQDSNQMRPLPSSLL